MKKPRLNTNIMRSFFQTTIFLLLLVGSQSMAKGPHKAKNAVPLVPPPVITGLQDQQVNENDVLGPIEFYVTDAESAPEDIILSVTSSDLNLIPTGGLSLSTTITGANIPIPDFGDAAWTATGSGVTSQPLASYAGFTGQVMEVVSGASATNNSLQADMSLTQGKQYTLTFKYESDGLISIGGHMDILSTTSGTIASNRLTLSPTTPGVPEVVTLTMSSVIDTKLGRFKLDEGGKTLRIGEMNLSDGTGISQVIGSLVITPAADASGVANVTVSATDGDGLTTSAVFAVTVTAAAVNTPPTINSIANQQTDKNVTLGPVSFTVSDIETPEEQLIVTAVSSDQALVLDDNIVLTGNPGASGPEFPPLGNSDWSVGGSGTTMTVLNNPSGFTGTAALQVNGVAAKSSLEVANMSFETGVLYELTFKYSSTGAVQLGNYVDVQTAVGASVNGGKLALATTNGAVNEVTITFNSNDLARFGKFKLIDANTQFVIGDLSFTSQEAGEGRTFTITPEAEQEGQVTITLTVSDGAATATEDFVLTVGATPPLAPNNLRFITQNSTSIEMIWDDLSLTEDGFSIERSLDSLTFTEVGTAGIDNNSFVDTGLSPGTNYYYRVRAFIGSALFSEFSNTIEGVAANANQVILSSVEDSYVRGGSFVESNFDEEALKIKQSSFNYTRKAYLKFDLSALPAMEVAMLRLYGENRQVDRTVAIAATGAEDSWAEDTLVWNNTPLSVGDVLDVDSVTIDPNFHEWNVTSFIDSEFAGDKIATIGMSDPNRRDRVIAFNDSESGVNTPQLIITLSGSLLPAAPDNSLVSNPSPYSLDLSWTDNSGNETGFEIWRSLTQSGGYDLLLVTASDVTSCVDTNLVPDTTYFYQVRAINLEGHSSFSAVATERTNVSIPGILQFLVQKPSSIEIGWQDNSEEEIGFQIERSLDGINFTQLATVAENVTSYLDNDPLVSTNYFYRVRAEFSNGTSEYSNTIEGSTSNPNEVILTAIEDSYVQQNGAKADLNYNWVYMIARGVPSWNQQSFVKFDLSSLTNIESASLNLYGRNISAEGSDVPVVIQGAEDNWTEDSLTWNNKPLLIGDALDTTVVNNESNFYEWDLSSFAQTEFISDQTLSLRIIDSETVRQSIEFNTTESRHNLPRLVVTSFDLSDVVIINTEQISASFEYTISGAGLTGTYSVGNQEYFSPVVATGTEELITIDVKEIGAISPSLTYSVSVNDAKEVVEVNIQFLETFEPLHENYFTIENGNGLILYDDKRMDVMYSDIALNLQNGIMKDAQDGPIVNGVNTINTFSIQILTLDDNEVFSTTDKTQSWSAWDYLNAPSGTYKYIIEADGQTLEGQFVLASTL